MNEIYSSKRSGLRNKMLDFFPIGHLLRSESKSLCGLGMSQDRGLPLDVVHDSERYSL